MICSNDRKERVKERKSKYVQVDRSGRWYLVILTDRDIANEEEALTSKHIAVSGGPGVRFQ